MYIYICVCVFIYIYLPKAKGEDSAEDMSAAPVVYWADCGLWQSPYLYASLEPPLSSNRCQLLLRASQPIKQPLFGAAAQGLWPLSPDLGSSANIDPRTHLVYRLC